jgi:hypothetical protein
MLTVMRRSGQVMVRYIQVLVSQMVQLCKLVKLWLVNFIHTFPNVVTLFRNLFAQAKLNIELCLARFTNQVPLMKLGLINVLHKVGDLGQRLLQIAHKIHQHVLKTLKREH